MPSRQRHSLIPAICFRLSNPEPDSSYPYRVQIGDFNMMDHLK